MKDADGSGGSGGGGGGSPDGNEDDGGQAGMDVDVGAPSSASGDRAAVRSGHHAFVVMSFRDSSLVGATISAHCF